MGLFPTREEMLKEKLFLTYLTARDAANLIFRKLPASDAVVSVYPKDSPEEITAADLVSSSSYNPKDSEDREIFHDLCLMPNIPVGYHVAAKGMRRPIIPQGLYQLLPVTTQFYVSYKPQLDFYVVDLTRVSRHHGGSNVYRFRSRTQVIAIPNDIEMNMRAEFIFGDLRVQDSDIRYKRIVFNSSA